MIHEFDPRTGEPVGEPVPETTEAEVPAYTSVGTAAIRRWLVPVAYQNFPPELLPPGLV